ncbi:ABC transporter ATP-binding protein [Alkaliphilus serpentinus]|uniref:ABC transporter ATP-binding protein n=1 Tax=Alkaliphilus serpentinus TaxID=1482731 RepID=A0A833MCI7_9FIRM|nr:ABC transporter ATP-binding protein [Alkaliphilus serpentinus]KAB3525510.1 ABC transporter ATP-binding protein [Alkaliphilus serpentinus]
MKMILIGENIVKSYGLGVEKRKILDGVSIEIEEGDFVSVMGPSGSGKSTLMYALSGMEAIDEGRVVFDEGDLSELGEDQLADLRSIKMGFVFQQPTLMKNLNILDNIILPSMRHNRKNTSNITEKARELMKKVGIEDLENRDITQVSGGQLQRAGICRALMSNPKMIFGDEPTGALNSKSAQEIMNILSDINKEGTTLMLVTHDAKVAAQSERILFMKDGKILSEMRLGKFIEEDMEDRFKKVTEKIQEIGI